MKRIVLIAPFVLLLAGCVSQPQTFAPPVQRKPVLDGQAPKPPKQVIEMKDPEADGFVVQDVKPNSGDLWRWTGKKPTFRIYVEDSRDRSLIVNFSVADGTMKDTGPIKLTFSVNDQVLDTVSIDKPGQRTFEKPVPPAMLRAGADNMVAIEIDKVWTSPVDKAQLGFILASVGLPGK